MDGLAAAAFVLATGLTVCGLAGTVLELAWGRRLSLGSPFVSRDSLSRSMVLVLVAGPLMVINELLDAAREGRIGRPFFVLAVLACLFWLAATGVFVLALCENVRTPLA